jgi:hypothetical protein
MRRLFGQRTGRGGSPQGLRTPHVASARDPNTLRELIRTDALQDWLRDVSTRELLEVYDAVVDEQTHRGVQIDAQDRAR